MANSSQIEPPMKIRTKKEGFDAIISIVSSLRHANEKPDAPFVGMMYVSFPSERKADEWNIRFQHIANHSWRNHLKRDSDLKFITACRDNDRATLDIIFASDEKTAIEAAEMRFPGMKFEV